MMMDVHIRRLLCQDGKIVVGDQINEVSIIKEIKQETKNGKNSKSFLPKCSF